MAHSKQVEVKESMSDLRLLMRKSIFMIARRVNMLIQIKKHDGRISLQKLSGITGADMKSLHTWRQAYLKGGLEALLRHNRKGTVSKIFGEAERDYLSCILENPKNGVQGYTELQKRMNAHFGKDFDYVTLLEYCKRHFGTRIKVARKSHVKKDEKSVSDFKKTSLKSSKPLPKR
jgi:hypothetical protein